MSWFDATGFANLAKTALKEAQRTIDKALDIKDEEGNLHVGAAASSAKKSPPVEDSDNFFASWGVSNVSKNKSVSGPTVSTTEVPKAVEAQPGGSAKASLSGSLWGSFTGSFFENPKSSINTENTPSVSESPVSIQPRKMAVMDLSCDSHEVDYQDTDVLRDDILCDDSVDVGGFEKSKLVVVGSLSEGEELGRDLRLALRETTIPEVASAAHQAQVPLHDLDRVRTKTWLQVSSAVHTPSSEAGSDVKSVSRRSSPESVEVIPDSLTSPSSVEVLDTPGGESVGSLNSPQEEDEVTHTLVPRVAATLRAELQATLQKYGSQEEEAEVEATTEVDSSVPLQASIEVIPEDETSFADSQHSSVSASSCRTMVPLDSICGVGSKATMAAATSDSDSLLVDPELCESSSDTVTQSDREGQISPQSSLTEEPKNSQGTDEALDEEDSKPSISTSPPPPPPPPPSPPPLPPSVIAISETSKSVTISGQTVGSDVKTLLAEAMVESMEENAQGSAVAGAEGRDQSPTSSESRSDLVKVESGHASGHTSGDEMETTTSSDIEIISSPNGDSSSTHSRQSPAKFLVRAHRGTLTQRSDRSDSGSERSMKGKKGEKSLTVAEGLHKFSEQLHLPADNYNSEFARLKQHLVETSTILESRESQVMDLSRRNAELEECISAMMRKVSDMEEEQVNESGNVTRVTEEFTARLANLERKYQQAVREKEVLQNKLEEARQDVSARLSSDEFHATMAEKEQTLKELREEGEKLAKQVGQQSSLLKKLRTKEKETENKIRGLREQLEEQTDELERLKKTLAAKEEVERKQIEVIRQLTSSAQKQEAQATSATGRLDDVQARLKSLQLALDESHREMGELRERALSAEMAARLEMQGVVAETHAAAKAREVHLLAQISDLQEVMRGAEEQHAKREGALREEIADVMQRLQGAEARNEELAQSVSAATKPLLRQLETLQGTFASQQDNWERTERHLTDRLSEAQTQLSISVEKEKNTSEQFVMLNGRISALESQLSQLRQEKTRWANEAEAQKNKVEMLEEAKAREATHIENLRRSFAEEVSSLHREVDMLEGQLEMERTVLEAERRKVQVLQEQIREKDRRLAMSQLPSAAPGSHHSSPCSSPTPSLGRLSLTGSIADSLTSSNPWPEEVFDRSGGAAYFPHRSSLYDSMRASGSSASILEGLQAQLKLREGEVVHLQSELSNQERMREAMAQELSRLTEQMEEMSGQLESAATAHQRFCDTEQKYNALLQMYGEKVEENQELRLDLQDIKDMYKAQIDQLLGSEGKS